MKKVDAPTRYPAEFYARSVLVAKASLSKTASLRALHLHRTQSGRQSTDLLKPEAQEWSCCIKARNVEMLRRIGTGDVKTDVEWPTQSCSHIRLAREIDLAKA